MPRVMTAAFRIPQSGNQLARIVMHLILPSRSINNTSNITGARPMAVNIAKLPGYYATLAR
jgi:hypothetical protein